MSGRGEGSPAMRRRGAGGYRVRRRSSAAVLAAVGLVLLVSTAVPASTVQVVQPRPLPIMMTVACVEAGEEGTFHLVNATEPEAIADRLPPQPAPSAALGSHSIRLIGTLDEFGVARHAGHKVWAKGLLIEDETERRLNLVSVMHLSPDCE